MLSDIGDISSIQADSAAPSLATRVELIPQHDQPFPEAVQYQLQ